MASLTNDMKEMLRAAYRVAPTGEPFDISALELSDMDEQARRDCAFALKSDPFGYFDPQSSTSLDGKRVILAEGKPYGIVYALSKLGRPIARQLAQEEAAQQKARRWKIAHRVLTALLAIAVPVSVAWLNRRIERLEGQSPMPTTQP